MNNTKTTPRQANRAHNKYMCYIWTYTHALQHLKGDNQKSWIQHISSAPESGRKCCHSNPWGNRSWARFPNRIELTNENWEFLHLQISSVKKKSCTVEEFYHCSTTENHFIWDIHLAKILINCTNRLNIWSVAKMPYFKVLDFISECHPNGDMNYSENPNPNGGYMLEHAGGVLDS